MIDALRNLIAQPADVGAAVAAARESARLTQRELADRLGIAQSHLAAIERGRKAPTLRTLQAIYAALTGSPPQ